MTFARTCVETLSNHGHRRSTVGSKIQRENTTNGPPRYARRALFGQCVKQLVICIMSGCQDEHCFKSLVFDGGFLLEHVGTGQQFEWDYCCAIWESGPQATSRVGDVRGWTGQHRHLRDLSGLVVPNWFAPTCEMSVAACLLCPESAILPIIERSWLERSQHSTPHKWFCYWQ